MRWRPLKRCPQGGWTVWPHHHPNLTITLTFIRPPTSEFNPNTEAPRLGFHPPRCRPVPRRHICAGLQPFWPKRRKTTEPDSQMKSVHFSWDRLPWDKCWCFVSKAEPAVRLRQRLLPECALIQWWAEPLHAFLESLSAMKISLTQNVSISWHFCQ